ncbi:MAG: hypothetical protein ACYC5N_05875 [Endomicrobiales bacterium]
MDLRALRVFVFILIAPLSVLPAYGQSGAGTGLDASPFDTYPGKKDQKSKPTDIYVKKIAARFERREDDIARLWHRGYGRNEIIKVLLIAAKSGKELREIVRQRDRGAKLSALAEKYGLDYAGIMQEAAAIRAELDERIAGAVPGADAPVSTGSFKASTPTRSTEAVPGTPAAPTEKMNE